MNDWFGIRSVFYTNFHIDYIDFIIIYLLRTIGNPAQKSVQKSISHLTLILDHFLKRF